MGKMFEALRKAEREKTAELKEDEPKATPEDIVLDDKLVTFFQPSSMVTEQFKRLRTFILKLGLDDNTLKTIMVTSAMAGEGKSMISANLAITIATELHSYALLVDADLRKPSLSELFGLEERKGLSNYLLGESEIPDVMIKTSIDKLSLIPSGRIEDNPVELIGSNKMKSLVEDLKSRYEDRYIIIDSSPILATTEPSVLNKMVDGIILVIRSGETPRESIMQALKVIDKEKILGVVLNDLDFITNAMIRRNFGTHRYYYDYRYAKLPPKASLWGRIAAVAGDMKMFLRRGKKKEEEKG